MRLHFAERHGRASVHFCAKSKILKRLTAIMAYTNLSKNLGVAKNGSGTHLPNHNQSPQKLRSPKSLNVQDSGAQSSGA